MIDENDELKAMLEKYRAPAEAGEKLALRKAARFLGGEFTPPSEFGPGGHWYWTLHYTKAELRSRETMPPEVGILDLDPKAVATVFMEANPRWKDKVIADLLEGLSRVIKWLKEFEAALREQHGETRSR